MGSLAATRDAGAPTVGARDPPRLAPRAAHLDALGGDRRDGGLLPHLDEALHRRDRSEREHHPQDRDQQHGEEQSDAQRDDPLGALHQAALGLDPERLGFGALVADHRRHRHHGERQQREVRRLRAREVPCDAAEQEGVGEPVDRRVEERATLAGCTRCLGQRTIEQIGQRSEDDEHEPDAQFAGTDGDRGRDAEQQAGDRQVIGREAGPAQRVTDRLDRLVDRRTELPVEHLRDSIGGDGDLGVFVEVLLDEVLDHGAVDGVDQDQPTLGRRLVRGVAQHPPRRAAAQATPHLLRGGVPDRESDGAVCCDQRRGLVDLHPPRRRHGEHAGRGQQERRPQPPDGHDRRVDRRPHQHGHGSEHQVDHTGPAAATVVRELVGPHVAGGVEVVGELVTDVVGVGHTLRGRFGAIGHPDSLRSRSALWPRRRDLRRGGRQRLRKRLGVGDRRHEVGVAHPARHDVDVQVVRHGTAGRPAEVEPDVHPARRVRGADRGRRIRHGRPQVGGLRRGQVGQVGHLAVRHDEQVTRGVREDVGDDEALRRAVHDVGLGVGEP